MNAEYKRIQNTYYFNLTSNAVAAGGVTATQSFRLPALPSLPNGESKTGIFRLLSATIGNQTDTNNIAGNGGFYVGFTGLSLRPQVFGGGVRGLDGGDFVAMNRFWIPNSTSDSVSVKDAQTITIPTWNYPQVVSVEGGARGVGTSTAPVHAIPQIVSTMTAQTVANGFAYKNINSQSGGPLSKPYEVLCGNPSGNAGGISLFDEHGVILAAVVGNINQLSSNICFSIELIDPDDDQNF
mgnify:FL=1|tara:strand:+ start:3234 stop:3950 length:717 start_codon:yes stop_codon:yes gene_type:complete